MKVDYWAWDGNQSTAYLDDEPDEDGRAVGADKHTDREVSLMWDKVNGAWVEVR